MKYSKLFGRTLKDTPKDASLISHKLLYQAGFIRESTAGRYYLLPLGLKVQQKMQKIIKQEMDNAGAQEIITPIMHPKFLWEETNRTNSVGFELMSITDRSNMEFVLGGTAEEMLVDLVRKFQISYKDLPFNLYQFSTKFRDELRARGGLLRVREFVMKDAYSFHASESNFKIEYENMKQTYLKIYHRFGLHPLVVESDNGYIGGEYCHEFIEESLAGESPFLMSEDENYAAHDDVATFIRDDKNMQDEEKKIKEVHAIRGNTMEDGVKIHGLPLWQQIKNIMFVNEKSELILAVIRGDLDVNEVKLMHQAKAYSIKHASEDEIRSAGSEPGFISPIGLKGKVLIIGDVSLRTIKNGYTGSNKKNHDLLNVNIDRDYQLDIEADIALAKEGFTSPNKKKLLAKRGIEVGNIFQLGYHYSSKMTGACFTDAEGHPQPYYMGCYGIGLGRTLATIAEVSHDEKGLIWPKAVSPYSVYLIAIKLDEEIIRDRAEDIYNRLKTANIDVIYDDRTDVGPGQKFADADLIGIPVRLVISPKTQNKIEWKERTKSESELIGIDEMLERLKRD